MAPRGALDHHPVGQRRDRTFVDGGITVSAGQPTFLRLALTCDAQGSITQWDIDSSVGTEEAQRISVSYRKIL